MNCPGEVLEDVWITVGSINELSSTNDLRYLRKLNDDVPSLACDIESYSRITDFCLDCIAVVTTRYRPRGKIASALLLLVLGLSFAMAAERKKNSRLCRGQKAIRGRRRGHVARHGLSFVASSR